jgi:hypothetical protein
MATIWKQGSTDYFVISTSRDSLGINDWKVFASDLSTGTVTDETANVTVTEIEYSIASPATGAVALETAQASKTIGLGVGEGANFTKGSAITYTTSNGVEYNSIKAINGDILTLNKPTGGIIAAAATITETGLTGDYRVVVDLTGTTTSFVAGGSYQFLVKAPSANIDITSEIFDVNDYDVQNELGSDITYIKQSLDNLSSGGGSSAKVHM